MPDLHASLQKYDLGHLRIIAELWGLELESAEPTSALEELCASLLDLEAVAETIDILSAEARSALQALVDSNGKIEWAIFSRAHGEIREMGAGKRDREQPHKKPISPAETLFYYGLLAKAFFDTEKGSQEFAYIPEDLLQAVEELNLEAPDEAQPITIAEPLGRPATPVEKSFEIPANDHILDDATTYLAAVRLQIPVTVNHAVALENLLSAATLIKQTALQPEAVKKFLEASRVDALTNLYQAWLNSQTFDELRLMPTIVCEGEWKNQPQITREFLMNLIQSIPQDKWWSLASFVKAVKEKYPDFQRPAGDYDSWFIKRVADGQYLRGFAYWDWVDGALIKYLIQTLHWLGKADLASPEAGKEFTAFRIRSQVESQKSNVEGKIIVSSNGRLTVSRYFSRAARYQIARFCDWHEEKKDEYVYSVSAKSLKRASEQGLKSEQLLNLLVKYTNGSVAPALVKALKRWDANGTEARVESLLALRVSKPEIMEEIRASKAGKFLGELLSPTAVIVKEGASQKVTEALADLGLLAEVVTNFPEAD